MGITLHISDLTWWMIFSFGLKAISAWMTAMLVVLGPPALLLRFWENR